MSGIRRQIAELSAADRARLESELLRGRRPGSTAGTISRRPGGGPSALSFAQQRLWFLQQWEPHSSVYHIALGQRLAGDLDAEALRRALETLVVRHEVLRTAFAMTDTGPVQVVRDAQRFELPVVDLAGLPSVRAEEEVAHQAALEAARPFDLTADLMVRAVLWRLRPTEHVFLVTLHHIAGDGWSLDVLARELAALYAGHRTGRAPDLTPLSVQYADYAAWQRERLQGARLTQELAYWRRQLDGAAPLALPTDRPRPVVATRRGGRAVRSLAADLAARLRAVSAAEGSTLFMTLFAAFTALLGRYADQTDVVVGTPIAGRTRTELEGLVGFFVNTLVLRADLGGDPSFRELLGRVKTICLEAYAHQEVPFEKLVEELAPARDASRAPFFDVMFAVQNAATGALDLPGLQVTGFQLPGRTARFDLSFMVAESRETLSAGVEYSTDLFAPSTIERLLGHWEALLAGIAADPDRRLSALPMMTASERQQVVVEWNRTGRAYPRAATVPALFEAQVAARPEAIAIEYGSTRLTYAELERRANRLAHRLQRLGVGPETLVAVCVERSLEMVVGLLGVLKAGGAYVPLDPEYPAERLAYMLADTHAPVVLTQGRLRERLPASEGTVIELDADWEDIAQAPSGAPPRATTAEALAYVMYTSGSTGRPKGVAVPHRGVVRLVTGTDYAEFGPEHVFLQYAPIAFDAATFEIWGALANGGRLVVAPAGRLGLDELGQVIQRHGVTTLWLTAGLFHRMVEEQLERLRGLRQLLAGGDVLSVPHVRKAVEGLPGCRVINGYGPTESTTFACCYPVTDLAAVTGMVPIGRPIANTTAYVLDGQREPVPIGVAGELYLGGDGLARGYWQRPELTAERFVTHPFEAEARLYRTGDRVRWREDGTLEFLGRLDQQVKIRGYRVEPGEVEGVLSEHAEVREAAVVVREDRPGDKRLVAYVVSAEELSPAALRAWVRARVPEYLVPSAFVQLQKLPLSPNGKVDRAALPAPEPGSAQAAVFVPPKTELERVIAEIWQATLGLDRVGLHDNFFEVGGHSLLSVQVQRKLERALSRPVPIVTLFECPTVAALAARLAASPAEAGPAGRHAADRAARQRDAFERMRSRSGPR